MSYRARRSFLKKHLRISLRLNVNTKRNAETFDLFAEKYLGGDGILFLRLIEKNTNPAMAGKEKRSINLSLCVILVSGELVELMWQQFVGTEV